ncbi:MAG: hypothetical protein OXG51_14290, partial [Gammaproteobacteria bacterium]|nr:hypothetical protein [Gammaproteobacteria bacterium]
MTLWKNLVVALVAAFMLAACSSSDNDTATTPDPEPTTMEPEPTVDEQIAALEEQINALRAELGLDPIDIDALTASVSELQGQVDDLKQQITDRDTDIADAAVKTMTARGKAVFDVLDPLGNATTAAQSAIATPRADAASPAVPAVMAIHGAAAKLSVASQEAFVDTLTAAGIDATASGPFTDAQAGDPATLPALHGFSGTMLTWADSARADTMTVYTDVGMARGVLFAEQYGGGTQGLALSTDSHEGIAGAAFDGRTGGLVEHDANAKLNTDPGPNDLVRLSGSYQGAAGIYTFTPGTGTCTSTVNADGSITFGGASPTTAWAFTANNGAMVSLADSAYMTFGWWMRDAKGTSAILDNVAVFYDAPHPDTLAVGGLT